MTIKSQIYKYRYDADLLNVCLKGAWGSLYPSLTISLNLSTSLPDLASPVILVCLSLSAPLSPLSTSLPFVLSACLSAFLISLTFQLSQPPSQPLSLLQTLSTPPHLSTSLFVSVSASLHIPVRDGHQSRAVDV